MTPAAGPATISAMTSEPDLRTRFPVDDAALSALHARAFSYPDPPPPIKVQPWRSRLERHSVAWVGAFVNEELVGFVHACWDGGLHAFLLDTVVDPNHRHRGIGSLLVEHLINEVKQASCQWLHVDFEPHLDPFYRAAGFRPTPAGLIQLT